jgi:hypothetical protein
MTARRAGAVAVAGVVAIALLVLVLAAWGASIGPGDLVDGEGPAPVDLPTATSSTATPDSGDYNVGDRENGAPGWLRTAAFLVNLAAAVLAVYILARYLVAPLGRWGLHRRRVRQSSRRAGPDEGDFTVLEPSEALAREMLDDAEAQRQELLDADTPRNAVVACWHRFETQAAAAGVGRHPWETSSEYTMRVLDLVDAHQPAVSRLGALYREARFSAHDLTEAHRREALAALDTIHRTIGIPA